MSEKCPFCEEASELKKTWIMRGTELKNGTRSCIKVFLHACPNAHTFRIYQSWMEREDEQVERQA